MARDRVRAVCTGWLPRRSARTLPQTQPLTQSLTQSQTPPLTSSLTSPPRLPRFFSLLAVSCVALLTGCEMVVLSPSGYIASQQAKLLVISTLLMLLIIVPVIVLTLLFAWRYRASNKDAPYAPDWDHSIQLELLIWSAPLLIIIALGALTWIGTHTLDPYRPLDVAGRSAQGHSPSTSRWSRSTGSGSSSIPSKGIAVVNELAAPVDTPVRFRITSSSVMNSFFIPAMAGMIYAMPSMETTLHAVINRPGEYEGFSANYSGAGFSGMRFKFLGMSPEDFQRLDAEGESGRRGVEPRATTSNSSGRASATRCVAMHGRAGPLRRDRQPLRRPGCDVPSRHDDAGHASRPRRWRRRTRCPARQQPVAPHWTGVTMTLICRRAGHDGDHLRAPCAPAAATIRD